MAGKEAMNFRSYETMAGTVDGTYTVKSGNGWTLWESDSLAAAEEFSILFLEESKRTRVIRIVETATGEIWRTMRKPTAVKAAWKTKATMEGIDRWTSGRQ